MVMKKLHQIAQGAPKRRSRNCRISPKTEVTRLELIAEPQPEIVASGNRRSDLEEFAV